jgi:hypothetical protein
VAGDVKGRLGPHAAKATGTDLSAWVAAGVPEAAIRLALGVSAKKSFGGWFKRTDLGEWLGDALVEVLPFIPQSPLAGRISDAESWCYA